MICRGLTSQLGLAVVAVLVFAVGAMGFGPFGPAGRAAAFQTAAFQTAAFETAALRAYVLAGGDRAAICGKAAEQRRCDHPACPACHLSGAAALPDTVPPPQPADLRLLADVAAPRESRIARQVRDPGRGLRAPPRV